MRTPTPLFLVPVLLVALLTAGCSWENLQRTGYETVESMRQQQCLDQLDSDCSMDRTRYDQYQAARHHLETREH